MASSPPPPFDPLELGAVLVELNVLTPAQWEMALVRAGGIEQLTAALGLLTRTPAHWAKWTKVNDSTTTIRSTALSEFQVQQIQKAQNDGGLKKLPKLLKWNDYLLIETLGKGGMGVVYKGWDLANQRYVAIKRTHRESPEARKRLRREASLQKYLNHPNIAKLYSREKFGHADLLVLEYLPGAPLNEVVSKRRKEKKPLPWAFVAEMAADLLDALDHAHGRNRKGLTVIHRDIKPANVMLMRTKVPGGEKYVPKLLDMGLAKWDGDPVGEGQSGTGSSMGEQITGQFQLLGTPEYMAPEQWEGGGAALPESDTYALGGTLYYALAGELPFPCKNSGNKMLFMSELARMHKLNDRPSVRVRRPDVPVELDRLLQQMLAVAPSYRGKPSDLRDQFRAILATPRPTGQPGSSRVSSSSISGILGQPLSRTGPSSGISGVTPSSSSTTSSTSLPTSSPKLVTPGERTSGITAPPPNREKPADLGTEEFLKLMRANMEKSPPPGLSIGRKSQPEIAIPPAPPEPASPSQSAPPAPPHSPARPVAPRSGPTPKPPGSWAAPFPDPPPQPPKPSKSRPVPPPPASKPTPRRASMDNFKAGVRNVRTSASLLMEDSRSGARERKAVSEKVFEFVKDTARPHRNPIPLILAVATVAGLAVFVGWMLAAWIGVMIGFTVGFAFVLTSGSDE